MCETYLSQTTAPDLSGDSQSSSKSIYIATATEALKNHHENYAKSWYKSPVARRVMLLFPQSYLDETA